MLKPKGLTKDHKPRMDFPRKMNSYKNFIDSSSPDTNEKKTKAENGIFTKDAVNQIILN